VSATLAPKTAGRESTRADAALDDSKVAEDEARTRFQEGQARNFEMEGA
jgi:hypothetical protein